ncbi:hypothetical protein [Amycolatopsis albispora]|uniref:Heparin-binding hemagglutinin n=1 Tax=Amycolatopsis albispora TaxID=1804986 RepID=A0A344LEZ0_9PSEU|nr:hypothetical protein [Amycolatopsis albispora]AXB46614.1 hypothetical protein A4R43_32685 [Amycolatopsis albispora]
MSTPTSNRTEEARKNLNTALEQVRTPLLAALGAGNLAAEAVAEAVNKAKARVTEGSETARKNIEELPADVESLRGKLDPAELRKLIDEYTDAALKLYHKLAESGEQAWDRFAAQPQVKNVIDQLEEVVHTVEERVEGVTTETRERVEDVLGKVTRKTRSVGEKTARTVEKVADEAAESVEDLGEDVAHEVRSASRKAANRTAPKPATAARRTAATSTTKKSTGSTGNTAAPKTDK